MPAERHGEARRWDDLTRRAPGRPSGMCERAGFQGSATPPPGFSRCRRGLQRATLGSATEHRGNAAGGPGSAARDRRFSGDTKMANKTTFTPDEWKKIMESVMLSGMAVTAADPSGLIGVLKESM